MSKNEREKMVLAMEYIVRQLGDEDLFMSWLYTGVADGDIPYGCGINPPQAVDDYGYDLVDLEYYIEDKHFSELMGLFLRMMARARKSGGLYCDGILDDNDN
jgi:hypothetical protein